MSSINHQIPEYQETIVRRYRKVPVHAIAGVRLNPSKPGERLSFVLESSFSDFNQETGKITFQYENDVLELYSEIEANTFFRLNPRLFKHGLIQEYDGVAPVLIDNTMTEVEIARIANIKDPVKFKKTIEGIAVRTNLDRIKTLLEALDRPKSFFTTVDTHYAQLASS